LKITCAAGQLSRNRFGETQAEQAAVSKRFGELGDYDVKATATVYFAFNRNTINAKGQQEPQALCG
jgi:hypothetical protein